MAFGSALAQGEWQGLITNLKEYYSHAHESSLWIYNLHFSCCGPEAVSAAGPRYDWGRLGCRAAKDHRNADVLLISGPVGTALVPEVKKIYEEMRTPKYVIALGACACTGGMFAISGDDVGVDKIIPVNIFVPGCPPRPESVLNAILQLKKHIQAVEA
jgi:NADH-quinone oxidoreductase B subunit